MEEKRYPYEFAIGEYRRLEEYLKDRGYKTGPSGSLRRKREDVGDIDFLVMGERNEILKAVEEYPEVVERKNKYEFKLKSGIYIHTIPETQKKYDYTLWQSTGPKAHVRWIKGIYMEKGRQLSTVDADERKIYEDVGLEYIIPEERYRYLGEDND